MFREIPTQQNITNTKYVSKKMHQNETKYLVVIQIASQKIYHISHKIS